MREAKVRKKKKRSPEVRRGRTKTYKEMMANDPVFAASQAQKQREKEQNARAQELDRREKQLDADEMLVLRKVAVREAAASNAMDVAKTVLLSGRAQHRRGVALEERASQRQRCLALEEASLEPLRREVDAREKERQAEVRANNQRLRAQESAEAWARHNAIMEAQAQRTAARLSDERALALAAACKRVASRPVANVLQRARVEDERRRQEYRRMGVAFDRQRRAEICDARDHVWADALLRDLNGV